VTAMDDLDYAKRKLRDVARHYGVDADVLVVKFDDSRQWGEAGYGYQHHADDEACILLDKRLFTTDQDRLAAVFLHEVGHLRLGHFSPKPATVDRIPAGRPATVPVWKWKMALKQSRRHEQSAEQWAKVQVDWWTGLVKSKGYSSFCEYVTVDPYQRLQHQLERLADIVERRR